MATGLEYFPFAVLHQSFIRWWWVSYLRKSSWRSDLTKHVSCASERRVSSKNWWSSGSPNGQSGQNDTLYLFLFCSVSSACEGSIMCKPNKSNGIVAFRCIFFPSFELLDVFLSSWPMCCRYNWVSYREGWLCNVSKSENHAYAWPSSIFFG